MDCKDCEYYFLKDAKDRPIFCCKCEVSYHWKQLIPDLLLYHLLIRTLDVMSEVLVWIEKKTRG